jgi:tRNA threonylcarbamoyladenosine biosynthesis protein TsaE
MKKSYISSSVDETISIAMEIGKNAPEKSVITLRGELGSGKTVFVKGIAAGMEITQDITSPTFSIMEIYEGSPDLYHFDLYRIETMNELLNLGFEDYWGIRGVSVIEWPDIALDILPEKRIDIFIDYIDENRRSITIEYTGH